MTDRAWSQLTWMIELGGSLFGSEIIGKKVAHLNSLTTENEIESLAALYPQHQREQTGRSHHVLSQLVDRFKRLTLISLFFNEDLNACKQNAYVVGKLLRMHRQLKPRWGGPNGSELLYSLVSDHPDLIHWESQCFTTCLVPQKPGFMCDRPTNGQFQGLEARLALQGDWENLHSMCEKFPASKPPKGKAYHRIDQKFYFALIDGDIDGMQSALNELAKPAVLRIRAGESEWPYESDLLSGWHMIFIKIARHHGFEVDIDSPCVPDELKAIDHLSKYEEPFEFMADFEMFTPLNRNSGKYIHCLDELSPRPKGQSPLTFDEARRCVEASNK